MKKLIIVLTHPLFISFFFCGLIISGEQMGGFYLLYILLGLPHLAIHSVFGIAGLICLFISYYKTKSASKIFNLLGALCMAISLLYFFIQPGGSYNYSTFYEVLPMLLLILFGILLGFFIVKNIPVSLKNNDTGSKILV